MIGGVSASAWTGFLKVKGEWCRFDDDYYRFLLLYRARCNLANATVSTMNNMLSQLTDTRVFVVDYQNMSIQSIVVIGAISDLQAQILQTYGLLNRPAGVLTNFLYHLPGREDLRLRRAGSATL